MGTIRQKKLANEVVKNMARNKPLNKQELVGSVGYSELSAEHKATEILNSKGVQEELIILGFDSNNAKRVVGKILDNEYAEERDRLKAAEMVFKVNGDLAPEKHLNINIEKRIISIDE